MRYIAEIRNDARACRAMISPQTDGCYVYLFDKAEDAPCYADYIVEDLSRAKQSCSKEYGIDPDEWREIPDPLEGCQDDWIQPVRIKGRDSGIPQWSRFEKLVDGKWIEIGVEPAL